MQKIEMSFNQWHLYFPRHAVARLQQRPIEGLTIETHQYRPFGHSFCKRHQNRMLLAVLAHKKLFDLKPTRVPPCNANEKWIRSRTAAKTGGFRVQK